MALTPDQISSLLNQIASTTSNDADCDGCFQRLAEFAERQLANREIPEALRSVESHLKQCACCQDEYDALLQALAALEDHE